GSWRKANPIPASMQRWSRRWQAGESNKERLRDILEEISRRSDWPHGSVEQIVGDDYASCMDEARAEALGIAPLAPMLAGSEGSRRRRLRLREAAGRSLARQRRPPRSEQPRSSDLVREAPRHDPALRLVGAVRRGKASAGRAERGRAGFPGPVREGAGADAA